MTTICPFAVYQPVANHSGTLSSHLGLVVHVQVGDGSCYGEFNNPASEASSTWQCMKDGTLLQFVDADLVAWTEMAGNLYYDSVETEGTPDEPFTDAQCATLARLIAWGHHTFGWPLQLVDHGQPGVTTHAHYPSGQPDPAWGDHPCPGSLRSGQLPAVLEQAMGIANAPRPVLPPPTEEDPLFIIACTGKPTFLVLAGLVMALPDGASVAEWEAQGAKVVNVDPAMSDRFAAKA